MAQRVSETTAIRAAERTTPARWPIFAFLMLTVLAVALLTLILGSVNIPLAEVVRILLGHETAHASWRTIVLEMRLPRVMTALLAGAALGVSGLQMQTLFRNPLADPFVLGVSSGASLGVALVVLGFGSGTVLLAGVSSLSDWTLVAAASTGAGVVFAAVLMVARRVRGVMTLLILGLMFGYLTGSMVSLLMHFSLTERLRAYISWVNGSFSGVTVSQLTILVPVVATGLALALHSVKALNALLLGETYARSMGLDIRRARLSILSSAALLTGAVTAFCGPIGFVGLAVPHVCRGLLRTSDHRVLLPAVMLVGGAAALAAGLIAQVPGHDVVLPLNAVTALFGAPFVILVLMRHAKAAQ